MKSEKQPFFILLSVFLIFLLAHIPFTANGQKQEVDAIYLNNGEVFRGILQDQLDADIVQLQTLCWNTRLFSKSEINRIEREKVDLSAFGRGAVSPNGYFNRTDIGVLIGSGNNDNNTVFSAQMVNGYKIKGKYFPGVGIGIEFYEHAVIPVFADFSYAFMSHGVSPFVRASFGYSIPVEDSSEQWGAHTDYRGGLLYAAGIGASIHTGPSSALVISLVYRFQSIKSVYTEDWNDDVLNLEKQYNRIAIRIGFMFD